MSYKVKKKKLTCEKIKYFKEDEKKAYKEYESYGLNKTAKDEKSHYHMFKNLEKKRKCHTK